MTVHISFQTSSVEATYRNVRDVYTKDSLLCVSFTDKKDILKFPLCNIWGIRSNYEQEEEK